MSAVLAEAVERAVAAAFEGLNGQVEQLVAAEIDRRLELLVAERLSTIVNTSAAVSSTNLDEPKVCRTCGEAKPVSDYERGRGTCRECRRAQARARVARVAVEGDRPADVQVG